MKSYGFYKKIQNIPIYHNKGRSTLNLTLGKGVRYPLTATALSDKQCEQVTKCFRWTSLGKAGVVRTAANETVNAPLAYGGMNLRIDVKELQFLDHMSVILTHGHALSVTGKLLRATSEAISIEAGVTEDPFQLAPVDLEYTTQNMWIKRVIQELHQYDVDIESSIQPLET